MSVPARKGSLCLLLGLLVAAVFSTRAWAENPQDKIGLYVTPDEESDPHYSASYTQALDTLKGYARVVWMLERWKRIEIGPGRYDWSSLDRRVLKAAERGFDVGLRLQVVLCGNDASKRAVALIQTPKYIGDTMESPAFRLAAVRFFAAAAQRYKGRVKYIAVGNSLNKYFEQNPAHWEGFKRVYPAIVDAIHAADRNIVVMSDLNSGEEFFSDQAKMSKYTDFFRAANDDAVGYLFYYISGAYYGHDFAKFGPENMQQALQTLHLWAGKKKIYLIETACFSTHPKTGADMSRIQARFVEMLLKAVMESDDILGVSWWLLYDAKDLPQVAWDVKAGFGLFGADGKPKPAWETWKTLAKREPPATTAQPAMPGQKPAEPNLPPHAGAKPEEHRPEAAEAAQWRAWTSSAGTRLEGKLVNVVGDKVRLQKRDGSVIVVRMDQLSAADREWLRKK